MYLLRNSVSKQPQREALMKMKLISVSIWCDHDKFMFLYTHQCLAIFRALEMWLQRSTILHQHLALTWRMSKSRQPRREALMRIRNHQCLRLRQSWLDSSHVENSSFAMLHLPSLAAPTRSTYCFEPSSQCQSWANNTGPFMEKPCAWLPCSLSCSRCMVMLLL